MDTYIQNASLTEPGVRYFLKETLKQCQQKKIKFYHFWTNIGFFILFIGILASLNSIDFIAFVKEFLALFIRGEWNAPDVLSFITCLIPISLKNLL